MHPKKTCFGQNIALGVKKKKKVLEHEWLQVRENELQVLEYKQVLKNK